MGPESRVEILNKSELLQGIDDFKFLTDKQKQMCYEHINYPELTKSEIASKIGIASSGVYAFFHSKKWETINLELASQQIRELIQLAVKTLRVSMLKGSSAVKLDAAIRVLHNADLIKTRYVPKSIKQDNKMIVLWDNGSVEPSVVGEVATASPTVNGDQTPILSPPTAA